MIFIQVIGRLTRDAQVRSTQNGSNYTQVSVAANEGYGDNQQVTYYEASFFGKRAESVATYRKGDLVYMAGHLRKYTSQNGNVYDQLQFGEISILQRRNPMPSQNYQQQGYQGQPQGNYQQAPQGYQQSAAQSQQNRQNAAEQQQVPQQNQQYQQTSLNTEPGGGWAETGAGKKIRELQQKNSKHVEINDDSLPFGNGETSETPF